MNKVKIATAFKTAGKFVSKHSPEILTGFGIAGMITTTVLAVRATPKATRLIEEAEHKKKAKLTIPETVKVCWKPYVPAAVTGVASVACLVGASSVSYRRNAALTAAYKLSETALTEYREQVVKTIGEKKEEKVRENVAKEQLVRNPYVPGEVIETGKGETICYDSTCRRYFKSSRDTIDRVVNVLNRRLLNEMYISLNEFYYEIGLEGSEIGDDIGWNVSEGSYSKPVIDISYASDLIDERTPCMVVTFTTPPKYGFKDF